MSKEISLNSVIRKTHNYVDSELDNGLVIMDLENNSYYGLDEIGKKILYMAENPVKVQEVSESLLMEYDVTPDTCEKDILELLKKLQEEGLITVDC